MGAGVQDATHVSQRHPQHRRSSNLQDDVTDRQSAPQGRGDERKLSVIRSSADGDAQFPRGAQQGDEAVVHVGAPVLLLHRRLRHGKRAGEEAREDSVIPVSLSNGSALNLWQGCFTPERVKVENNSSFTGYNIFCGSKKKPFKSQGKHQEARVH